MDSIKSKFLVALSLIIIVSPASASSAKDMKHSQESAYPMKQKELKHIVTEKKYYYYESFYEDPIKVIPVMSGKAEYDTPESAAISIISGLINAKYDLWFKSWTEASRKIRQDQDRQEARNKEFWTTVWKKNYSDLEAYLVRRIEFGRYVIIDAHFVSKGERGNIKRKTGIVLKLENGKWLRTLDLASDPMGDGWRKPEDRRTYVRGQDENPEKIFEDEYWRVKGN